MSEGRTAAGAAHRVGTGTTRLVRAWRALPHESRLAAFASAALFLTLFLPWYQVTLIAPAKTAKLLSASATITGWGAFSFVEAAVLLVAAAVVALLFQRAEGRAFHLPGGDGGVITAAGVWTCVLIVWQIFDKQGATTNGPSATTSGVEWGIFIALAAAAFLAYSGSRIRAAHRPEPPLPGEDGAPDDSSAAATAVRPRRGGATAHAPERPRRQASRAEAASATATATERPRRRARAPMPVPAEPTDHARGPAPAGEPVRAGDPAPTRGPVRAGDARPVRAGEEAPAAPATPHGPRRRATADELFERVVPEDPPIMRFGRIRPAPGPWAPPAPVPEDEQLTIPFREDPTLALGEDATLPLSEDATLPLGEDETLPLDR